MKRTMGIVEVVFDMFYLIAGTTIGLLLLVNPGRDQAARTFAGIMALLLVGGDSFHLVPRIRMSLAGDGTSLRTTLGRGKQITSITMTVFYLFLWHIGSMEYQPENGRFWTISIYILATIRTFLCLLPQNKWTDRHPPLSWAIWRNIPFIVQGMMVALLFVFGRNASPGLENMYLAIILSFVCYVPVVVWSNTHPKIGMLMLPKTCAYLWMLCMCLSL